MQKGLSLVEIMIVIAIMGIFAGIALPRFLTYLDTAKVRTTEQNLMVIKQGINAFYGDTGHYPERLVDLVRKPHDEKVARGWSNPYVEQKNGDEDGLPLDGWKRSFEYRLLDQRSGKPYELFSYGSHGEDGPEDERIYA